jgi:CHASE2 domain-containing sensor protein
VKGSHTRLLEPALGAVLVVSVGFVLWWSPLGDPWVRTSYDSLFRFGSRPVTNNVALILMDNDAYDHFQQTRDQPWDRALHAQLLDRLADDGADLVVFDSFFKKPRDAAADDALAAAMRRQQRMVLMAEPASINHPGLAGTEPILPDPQFLAAAGNHWGVAWLSPDIDGIVRQHWPFPSPGPYPSLPESVAKLAGAKLDPNPQERWLRYYGQNQPWPTMSYRFAFSQPTNYFRHKIVFIGIQPKTSIPDGETDEFSTPYTGWTGDSSGGVEILLTETVNLINHEWLRRPALGTEFLALAIAGILLGGGLCWLRLSIAAAIGAVVAVAVGIGAIEWSFSGNFWFPWLIISGGQIPCALGWALAVRTRRERQASKDRVTVGGPPKIPGYKLFPPALGEGSYGKVWLAQKRGQWCALKIIYREKFGDNPDPYEREFSGIARYQRVSGRHPGLLRVDFISEKKNGFFYYTMELGDSLVDEWKRYPALFKLRDLVSERNQLPGRRLPVRDSLRIGIALADALDFLHREGLTHRDLKPQNIIFVGGQPKLADPGLVAEIRPVDEIKTYLGTPGFMPPSPEPPGTPQADIYGLGMVLYVTATGRPAALFPELASSLVADDVPDGFLMLNQVILKACAPNVAHRYQSAAEFRDKLKELETELET